MREVKPLIQLIRALKKSGVRQFKNGDLEIEFGAADTYQTEKVESDPPTIPSDAEIESARESAAIEDNAREASDELANMVVENPALYEQLLVNQELESSGSDPEEDYD